MDQAKPTTSAWTRFGPAGLIAASFVVAFISNLVVVGGHIRLVPLWLILLTILICLFPAMVQYAIAGLRNGRLARAFAWGQAGVNSATYGFIAIAAWFPVIFPDMEIDHAALISQLVYGLLAISLLLLIALVALVLIGRFARKR